jgi:hypothetical protein
MKQNLFLTGLLILILSFNAFSFEHPGGLHSKKQLTFVKKHISNKSEPYYTAYKQLLEKAELALNHPNHALEDFKVPGYYIDSLNHRKNSAGLQSDSFDAYACALAWQLTGKKKYAEKALQLMNTWSTINKKYSDFDGVLVMSYSGTGLIIAGELLLPYKNWNRPDREKYFNWCRSVYRKACNEIRDKQNNWADWGRFGSVLCAHLLDDPSEIQENSRLIKSDLFKKIDPDGHMPFETQRGANGIWYTYFSLAPMTAASYVIYNSTGENLFELNSGEKSIKKAVDYLYYYSLHPNEWPWFKNPNKSSPDSWPGNLFEAMYYIYKDSRYQDYIAESRPLCYDKHHFAWSFPTLMSAYLKFPN